MDFSLWFSFHNLFFSSNQFIFQLIYISIFSNDTQALVPVFRKKNDLQNVMVAIVAVATFDKIWNGKWFLAQFFSLANREGPQTASIHICLWHSSHAVFRMNVLVWKILLKSSVLLIFFPLLLYFFQFAFKCSICEQSRKEEGERKRDEKQKKLNGVSNRFG